MSKPRRQIRGIRMFIDDPFVIVDHPSATPGLKRSRYTRERDHRQGIVYGTHCAKELLDRYARRTPLDDLPLIQDWMNTRFPVRDYQRPLLEPLPIPNGRGERCSSAVLAQKHLMADPMIIRRQQEENPYHPAKISWPPKTDADAFFQAVSRCMHNYSSQPQIRLSDLADFEHPFETKLEEMARDFPAHTAGHRVGKIRSIDQWPLFPAHVFVRWLENSRHNNIVRRK